MLLVLLILFAIHRNMNLIRFMRFENRSFKPKNKYRKLPHVAIQLPIYNEQFVIKRLLDSINQINYPKDLLHIQILDDSTDVTSEMIQEYIGLHTNQSCSIEYRHRNNRHGYKAGALQEGLKSIHAELILILDADFIAYPEILHDMIHFFTDPKIGAVQLRWGHINRKESLLTKIQSFLLDGHFVIEHQSRIHAGCFINFNGTAGMWRKRAISESGGWQFDTLTEDLDLSYRAQLNDWKIIYLMNKIVNAELPASINAFKSQQHRWAKGSIQTAIKLLPKILKSEMNLKIKIESIFHLTSNLGYVFLIILIVMMLPWILILEDWSWTRFLGVDLPIFLISTISMGLFYWVSDVDKNWSIFEKILMIPLTIGMGVGLAINNARAAGEALFNYQTAFIRTPKSGERIQKNAYHSKTSINCYFEVFMGIYFSWVTFQMWRVHNWLFVGLFLIFQYSFYYLGLGSLLEKIKASSSNRITFNKKK